MDNTRNPKEVSDLEALIYALLVSSVIIGTIIFVILQVS